MMTIKDLQERLATNAMDRAHLAESLFAKVTSMYDDDFDAACALGESVCLECNAAYWLCHDAIARVKDESLIARLAKHMDEMARLLDDYGCEPVRDPADLHC